MAPLIDRLKSVGLFFVATMVSTMRLDPSTSLSALYQLICFVVFVFEEVLLFVALLRWVNTMLNIQARRACPRNLFSGLAIEK